MPARRHDLRPTIAVLAVAALAIAAGWRWRAAAIALGVVALLFALRGLAVVLSAKAAMRDPDEKLPRPGKPPGR